MTLAGTSLTIGAANHSTVGFWGLQVGDVVMFTDGGAMEKHTVAAFVDPWHVTLDSAVVLTPTLAMWPLYHADGNSVQLWVATNSAAGTMTPNGYPKLTGGATETSFHLKIDFTAASIAQLRQAWFTAAPLLNYDSGGANPALMAYVGSEYSIVFTNWAVTDAGSVRPLKVAGLGTVTVGSRDAWAAYNGSWSESPGFYVGGFLHVSTTVNDYVEVNYSCQAVHDLYLGTQLGPGGGIFTVLLDGGAQADIDTLLSVAPPITARKLVASGVAAGSHVVRFTVKFNATNCYFDFAQAAVKTDVIDPPATYPGINLARDSDTGWTGFVTPFRNFDISERAGFQGDIDFFAGSLFPLKRVRSGGFFHQATISITQTLLVGDAIFVTISGISVGVGVTSLDTHTTVAQRAVNAINTLFVGVCAARTGTPGELTITLLSPINGFTLSVSLAYGSPYNPATNYGIGVFVQLSGTIYQSTQAANLGHPPASSPAWWSASSSAVSIAATGDINAGNEGVWQADNTQANPLNRGLADYLADFCTIAAAKGRTVTVAFSDEILGPPDVNTSAGAWAQRYANGATVLTSTGFGSWGAGFVESVAAGVYKQTGHGYVTGNIAHVASGLGSGVWIITVTDADHYQLTTQLFNSGSYVPAATDSVFIELQTTQCAFNPSTVTPYLAACYKQAAGIMNTAGLTPWLQFGEFLHWFFSYTEALTVAGFTNAGGLIKVQTVAAHQLATGQTAIRAGTRLVDGTGLITVVDATHFTVDGSTWPGGSPPARGTVSGGGMALYDANQAAAAVVALGRALASFYTQDDLATINAGADRDFLAARIKAHIDSIRTTVLATYAGAKFELLFPYDVCFSTCYYTDDLPYPQGGRLNRAINFPAAYLAKAGSGLDRMKMEALSWGATFRNLDSAIATMRFPLSIGTWAVADVAYLIPWFNGGCPWTAEFLASGNLGIPSINFWAGDHFVLLSPSLPLPVNASSAGVF